MLTAEEEHQSTGEDGENYFVSMTDMMVGVLFIFLIMLMVFALDFRTRSDDQSEALEAARRAAQEVEQLSDEVRSQIRALDEASETRRRLLTQIQESLLERDIRVELSPNSDVLRITENAVQFRSNQSALEGNSLANVITIAGVLADVLRDYVACRIEDGERLCQEGSQPAIETVFIEGHTDIQGSDDANWRLSTFRAAETYQQLILSSPELREYFNRQGEEILSISGYSSTRPVDPDNLAANRRIDLRFVMESDSRERMEKLARQTEDLRGEVESLIRVLGGRP